jgi:hypothetical protein
MYIKVDAEMAVKEEKKQYHPTIPFLSYVNELDIKYGDDR